MIQILDLLDGDCDLESTDDDEPSLGHYIGGIVDAELDDADHEPDLGSLDHQIDQRLWAAGSADDVELDESDHEHSSGAAAGDEDPIFRRMLPPSALVGSAVPA